MDKNPKFKDEMAALDLVLTTPGSKKLSLQRNLKKGLKLYAAGCSRQALWAFSLVLDEDPANVLAHYLCGLALRTLDLSNEARAEWRLATVLSANKAQSLTAEWASQMAHNLINAEHARLPELNRDQQPN